MKTKHHLLSRATSIFCLAALLWIPGAQAQRASFDAQLAHADGFGSADFDAEWRAGLPSEAAEINALIEAAPIMSRTDWKAYGQRLQDALTFEHEGLRHSALRHIIAYADQLELGNEAVVDLMRIYRDDASESVRRMAVVALGELESPLAMAWLERSRDFEKSDAVKRTIAAVVSTHRAT